MGALLTGALVHANKIWGITVTRLRGFLGKMWLALHSIARFGGEVVTSYEKFTLYVQE